MFFCLFIKWKHNYGKLCIGCLHVLDHIDYGWGKKRMWIENAQNQDLFNDIYILTSANHASHCSRTKWLEIIIKWWETVAKNKKIKKKRLKWEVFMMMMMMMVIALARNGNFGPNSECDEQLLRQCILYISYSGKQSFSIYRRSNELVIKKHHTNTV